MVGKFDLCKLLVAGACRRDEHALLPGDAPRGKAAGQGSRN